MQNQKCTDIVESIFVKSYRFLPGECIIQRGKRPLGVYFILEGLVYLVGDTPENMFLKLEAGSFVGEQSIVSDKCSSIFYMYQNK